MVSKLKKKADSLFSLATRYRFGEVRDGEWVAQCVTCVNPVWLSLKKLQCGHFMSRRFNATRFSEPNTAPQCYGCNVMHQGEQYRFATFIDGFYGAGTALELEAEAREAHPFTVVELEQIIADSIEQIKFYEKQGKEFL